MAGKDEYVVVWMAAVGAMFDSDDSGPMSELFAQDCVFTTDDGVWGNNRDEIMNTLQAARKAGWQSHKTFSASAADGLMTIIGQNEFADGSRRSVAAVAKFDDEGRICLMHAIRNI
ncbi:MAG: hypothetical protein ACKVWR_06910 [Acidimicrobiales bacterium]